MLPLHQGGMCANASDTYARLRSAMPIQPVFADWIPGPIPWPITADRLADGARVELARDFRPNSLSRTAPLPHGPPSMPVFSVRAHRPNLDKPPHGERFSCGVRGVGRIRTSGGLRPCCFRDSRIRPLCHYSTDPHEGTNWLTYSCGSRAPGGIRTHDRTDRSRLLWSTELQEQGGCLLRFKKSDNPFPKE